MDQIPWLLLLYSLPAHRNTQRVAVWRRFKKIGALQLTTSTYLLPDQPGHYEHFQWLTKLIRDSGGGATLVSPATRLLACDPPFPSSFPATGNWTAPLYAASALSAIPPRRK